MEQATQYGRSQQAMAAYDRRIHQFKLHGLKGWLRNIGSDQDMFKGRCPACGITVYEHTREMRYWYCFGWGQFRVPRFSIGISVGGKGLVFSSHTVEGWLKPHRLTEGPLIASRWAQDVLRGTK